MKRFVGAVVVLLGALPLVGQVVSSHLVNADGTLAFRYKDAAAKAVSLQIDTMLKPLPMERGEDGTWTVTTPVMAPDIYGYSFVVDGVAKPDPRNTLMRPNYLWPTTEVVVPGATPEAWELAAVPHGEVETHYFTTHEAQHMPQNQDAYVVYTPAGYDRKRKGGYPVLYLLHGYSDTETAWVQAGRANLIMDRLIADGKAQPMIVVMPLGYGELNIVLGTGRPSSVIEGEANTKNFERTLVNEVMPAVAREYNVAKGREKTAIVGLSMGGHESLTIGLRHPELFAWVGGFSSGLSQKAFDTEMPGVTAESAKLRLLWVACGVDDRLITPNREFVTWAKAKGLPVTPVETEGAHQWPVWRRNLLAFAPLLFR